MANLIVYYSRKGENYFSGQIKSIVKGNTAYVAEFIQEAVGGDLFEIETITPYPADYYACTDAAKVELRAKARPEIKGFVEGMDSYDTIFIGYPSWWGTCPMCVFTFLEHYDLTGKRIVPFCTNEGSGLGTSIRDLKKVCKGATVEDGLSIPGSQAADSQAIVAAWAAQFAK